LRCIRACSALEALRNALYKCSTYLLTYLSPLLQLLKCKIRGGRTLHSGLGPWQWSRAFSWHYNKLRWGTLWAINWRWGNGVPLLHITHYPLSFIHAICFNHCHSFGFNVLLYYCRPTNATNAATV